MLIGLLTALQVWSVGVCVFEEEKEVSMQGVSLSNSGFLFSSNGIEQLCSIEPSAKMEMFSVYPCYR